MRALRWLLGLRRVESALIVPVSAAEPVVGQWRERCDPSARRGMPAHVTSLYPFLDPEAIDESVERELRSLLSAFEPFSFRLVRVGRFPGVLYLAPEPVEPFVGMTEAIQRTWPDHPPYGGAFETVVPHLTVAQGREPQEAAARLETGLPITAEAGEVRLMTTDRRGQWSVRGRFPLGSVGAPGISG